MYAQRLQRIELGCQFFDKPEIIRDMLDEYPNLSAYVARGEARPTYRRAFDAQMAAKSHRPDDFGPDQRRHPSFSFGLRVLTQSFESPVLRFGRSMWRSALPTDA